MKKLLTALALLTAMTSAQATLIDNGSSVTDTETGYEWLDLGATVGMSFNSVVAQLGTGGAFDGWSLAGLDDIYTLFEAAGGNGTYSSYTNRNTYGHSALSSALLTNWGAGSTHNSTTQLWFHLDDTTPGGYTTGMYFNGDFLGFFPDGFTSPLGDYDIGTALYRHSNVSAVPAPAAAWLFGSGFLGLIGVARRKKSA